MGRTAFCNAQKTAYASKTIIFREKSGGGKIFIPQTVDLDGEK